MQWISRVCVGVFVTAATAVAWADVPVVVRSVSRVQFPGVVAQGANPQEPGDVDCSSPAHWDNGAMCMFYSTGHPFRSSGPDLLHLSRPSQRVTFDNEATWNMGARWIEATHKTADGTLYMWYHNEPPLPGGKTAPRIGEMVSMDNGLNWKDLGNPAGWTAPAKILDAADLEKSKWYPQVMGLDAARHETDKLAGKTLRLFVAGVSKWELVFLRPDEKPPIGNTDLK